MAGILTSTAGLSLAPVAGLIGGDLAFRLGIGVNRGAFEEPPGKWKQVLDDAGLQLGVLTRVVSSFGPLLFFREGESTLAVSASCTHAGALLDEGEEANGCVTYPCHGSVIDARDGVWHSGFSRTTMPRSSAGVASRVRRYDSLVAVTLIVPRLLPYIEGRSLAKQESSPSAGIETSAARPIRNGWLFPMTSPQRANHRSAGSRRRRVTGQNSQRRYPSASDGMNQSFHPPMARNRKL